MTEIDDEFCFYDDEDYRDDADRDSRRLREWHRQLWSKRLPTGDRLEWLIEPDGYLVSAAPHGPFRVSSDTIATSHSNYKRFGIEQVQDDFSAEALKHYERAFYTIGGFIIFPPRPQSLNQRRRTDSSIADRFDLTLECIRRHYVGGPESPLTEILNTDAGFFELFGRGAPGFTAYVDFFQLQDLVSNDSISIIWLDGVEADEWDFRAAPLPRSESGYRKYLDNVAGFVASRNRRIRRWCQEADAAPNN